LVNVAAAPAGSVTARVAAVGATTNPDSAAWYQFSERNSTPSGTCAVAEHPARKSRRASRRGHLTNKAFSRNGKCEPVSSEHADRHCSRLLSTSLNLTFASTVLTQQIVSEMGAPAKFRRE
jgi:hypothetical protein